MTRARRNTPLIVTCSRCGSVREWWASRLPTGVCYQCRVAIRNAIVRPDYHRDRKLRYRYNLTLEQVDAKIAAQGGACAICGRTGLRLVVDHDHDTGRVRDMLCDPCNRGLGGLADNIDRVSAALAYLLRHADIDPDMLDVRVDLSTARRARLRTRTEFDSRSRRPTEGTT